MMDEWDVCVVVGFFLYDYVDCSRTQGALPGVLFISHVHGIFNVIYDRCP
jgi:hypothetical protein